MDEKKIMAEEDMMIDFAEMTGFDFNSLDYQQVMELHKMTEYDNKPDSFKFGHFDLADMFHSFITDTEMQ